MFFELEYEYSVDDRSELLRSIIVRYCALLLDNKMQEATNLLNGDEMKPCRTAPTRQQDPAYEALICSAIIMAAQENRKNIMEFLKGIEPQLGKYIEVVLDTSSIERRYNSPVGVGPDYELDWERAVFKDGGTHDGRCVSIIGISYNLLDAEQEVRDFILAVPGIENYIQENHLSASAASASSSSSASSASSSSFPR